MLPIIRDVHFEQSEERLKIVLPTKHQPVWLLIYSVLTVVWLIGFVWAVVFILRDIAFSGERYAIVFTIMLLIWLYIWYRLGRILWRQWQYYAARREILFLNKERLIIRRPVSLLGITDAYDFSHVSPFTYNEEEACPSFDYGSRHIYFGRGLEDQSGKVLVNTLNDLYFYRREDDDMD